MEKMANVYRAFVASRYGKVEDMYFPKEEEIRTGRGFCYVRFDNPKANGPRVG